VEPDDLNRDDAAAMNTKAAREGGLFCRCFADDNRDVHVGKLLHTGFIEANLPQHSLHPSLTQRALQMASPPW
jgi:hypothetical protein